MPVWKLVIAWGALIWLLFVTFRFEGKFPSSLDPAIDFLAAWGNFSLIPFLKASVGYAKSIFFFTLIVVAAFSWGA